MASDIRFGTDGWRAIIGHRYTTDNVARIADATARWLRQQNLPQKVLIGWDTRFGSPMFASVVAQVCAQRGLEVVVPDTPFVTTPMLSLATRQHQAGLGIMLTASHNPPLYHGYKLKAHFGGPLSVDELKAIEGLLSETAPSYAVQEKPRVSSLAMEDEYVDYIEHRFDMPAIRSLPIVYEAMYGAGQRVVRRLLPQARILHGEVNPSFGGVAPEPIARNLQEAIQFMKEHPDYVLGLVTDGDADRIALLGREGRFVDAQHTLLLLVHYLAGYQKKRGKIVVAVSATERLRIMARHYGLPIEYVPVGFKHIAPRMVSEEVLLGGEESGGIGLVGHIPERDGIYVGLTIAEFMARQNRYLEDLIQEVYEIVGPFAYVREDLHLTPEQKQQAIARCQQGGIDRIADWKVEDVITIDGFKFILEGNRWLLMRPSGTEPVLRIYAEANTEEEARKLIQAFKEMIL